LIRFHFTFVDALIYAFPDLPAISIIYNEILFIVVIFTKLNEIDDVISIEFIPIMKDVLLKVIRSFNEFFKNFVSFLDGLFNAISNPRFQIGFNLFFGQSPCGCILSGA
jgi:hypothetical protein